MSCHAEVLDQQIAGKDVRQREVSQGLAVVDHRCLGRRAVDLAQVEVEGPQPSFDIEVANDELVAVDARALGGFRHQFREHRLVELREREFDVGEFLGIDQPTGAIVAEHELVPFHDLVAARVLRESKAVADDLEHEIVGGEREADHHEPLVARRMHETVVTGRQVIRELPIALGLALAHAAEHGVELVDRLVRQDRVDEIDRALHRFEVDEEVRARETEQDADVVVRHHDFVDGDAVVVVAQRNDQRRLARGPENLSDQVGPARLVEHRRQEVEPQHLVFGVAAGAGGALDFLLDPRDVPLQIRVGQREIAVREQLPDDVAQRAPVQIAAALDRMPLRIPDVEADIEELGARIGADSVEDPSADRVEEGLGERAVGYAVDACAKGLLQRRPEFTGGFGGTEQPFERADRARHRLGVELQALHEVPLGAAPVARLEALLGAARDAPEVVVVLDERLADALRGFEEQVAPRGVRHVGEARLRVVRSARWRTRCT